MTGISSYIFKLLSTLSAAVFLSLIIACETSKKQPNPTDIKEALENEGSKEAADGEILDFEAIAKKEKEEAFLKNFFSDSTPIVTAETAFQNTDSILMTFAGDIMAHTPNFSRGHYDEIYKDIESIIQASSFSFANLETPVDEKRDFSTYPSFNVHQSYSNAAIQAGFNVFSLANNHTNDQGLEGIRETKSYFDTLMKDTADSERPVYANGLKDTPSSPFTYNLIHKDGWTVLFMAVTEILNQGAHASYINYIRTDEKARKNFIQQVEELRAKNPCDIFVLSIHCSEPEYILTINKTQAEFYHNLLDAGVDVVWANHPHVAKDWEVIADSENIPRKMIFYAMGNSISGQRYSPSFSNPAMPREYTGDGFIAQVRFIKDDKGIHIVHVNPTLITTYVTPELLCVIKRLDDNFVSELREKKLDKWANYLEQRIKLMKKIKGKTSWQ